jgi:transcriptional regulator with XRE-family HTH domain
MRFSPDRLISARQGRGYTRKEFAELSMIPLQIIRMIEKGKTRPTNSMIKRFSSCLNFPVKWFEKTYQDAIEESREKVNIFICGSFGCRISKI